MTFPLPNMEDIAILLLLTYAEVIGLFQCFQCFLKFITSCTIKPVLGVTIKAIFKLSVCILQNCKGIGVRVHSPPQHLTTPLTIAKTTSISLFSAPQDFSAKSACSDHALITLTTPMRDQSAKRRHMHFPAKPISKSRDVFSQSISDM